MALAPGEDVPQEVHGSRVAFVVEVKFDSDDRGSTPTSYISSAEDRMSSSFSRPDTVGEGPSLDHLKHRFRAREMIYGKLKRDILVV